MPITKRAGKRKTVWVVDYRDSNRKRRYITCATEEEAVETQARILDAIRSGPNARFCTLAERWLELTAPRVRPQTLDVYRGAIENLIATFGERRILSIRPSEIQLFLARKLGDGLAPATVSRFRGVMSAILEVAVNDGYLDRNPCRSVRGVPAPGKEDVEAFTPAELDTLLATAEELYPWLVPFYLFLARTGVRAGEGLALRWEDIDLDGELVEGHRAYRATIRRSRDSSGEIGPTKNGRIRKVDLGRTLREVLERERQGFRREYLKHGGHLDQWVFREPSGIALRYHIALRRMRACLKKAGLPVRFHLHSLRHTYASIHLALGAPVTYVKEQLGHASIQITVDTYGRWLSKTNMEAADRLDEAAELLGRKKKKALDEK